MHNLGSHHSTRRGKVWPFWSAWQWSGAKTHGAHPQRPPLSQSPFAGHRDHLAWSHWLHFFCWQEVCCRRKKDGRTQHFRQKRLPALQSRVYAESSSACTPFLRRRYDDGGNEVLEAKFESSVTVVVKVKGEDRPPQSTAVRNWHRDCNDSPISVNNKTKQHTPYWPRDRNDSPISGQQNKATHTPYNHGRS